MPAFTSLACNSSGELVFGSAVHPLTCGFDLTIGAGHVYPEINFTLLPTKASAISLDMECV